VLHKEIPFLRIGVPLCAGIVTGLYFSPDLTFLATVCIILIIGFTLSLFFNKYQANLIFGLTLTISFYLCGMIIYSYEKTSLSRLKPEKTIFLATLADYPEEKENSYRVAVKLRKIVLNDRSESVNGSILLYIKKDTLLTSFLPGDLLIFRCTPVEITNKLNPEEFDYRFFMENQGIRYYAYIKVADILRHYNTINREIIYSALITREKIIAMFREKGLSGNSLALVSAITLGQKRMLDPEQKLNFMKAGVMHIMAVSGLHAIILSLFIFNVLFFMKGRMNIVRVLITIIILWSFAFVTGLTPSVLRATLMYSFLQAGKLMKRPANSINSVLASAFVLIVVRPSVIFDAGFLLSYSAVIYIISFYTGFYNLVLFKDWLTDKIWQSGIVTIIAQAGTLPLTIMLFNRFPTYFILANVTIVPVSNLLIIIGCLIPVFYHVHFLSGFLALLLNYLTIITDYLTATVASMPHSTIESIGMSTTGCILLTCAIFVICTWIINRKSMPVLYPVIFFTFFAIEGMTKDITTKMTNELIVYNTPGQSTIAIRTGKILHLYSDTSFVRPEVIRHCSAIGLKINSTVLKNDFTCLNIKNKRILITRKLNNEIISTYKPDIVIMTGQRPVIETNFNPVDTGLIIFTSEAIPAYRLPQSKAFSGIRSIHMVRTSGAIVKEI